MREPGLDLGGLRDPSWDLAPPAQVRRRGEQLTRRRRARAAIAGVGAVALLTVPAAATIGTHYADSGTGAAAPSAQPREGVSPDRSWLTAVPATFDLARGLPGTALSATPEDDMTSRVTACGRARWIAVVPADATDAQAVTATDPAGSRAGRLLVLYPDDAAARDALHDLRRFARSCSGSGDAGDLGLGPGIESWGYDAAAHPGAESVLAIRVGNALLVNRAEGPASSAGVTDLDRLSIQSVDVVRQMCVFAETRC